MRFQLGAKTILAAVLCPILQLAGCGGQGRIRVERSQLVGSYVTNLDKGSERLELKDDGSNLQEVISPSRPFHHVGQWHVENHLLNGSDVILSKAVVSEDDDKNPVRIGDIILNVHDHSGHVALARNEAMDWYYERSK
jgi:hypothetical protein